MKEVKGFIAAERAQMADEAGRWGYAGATKRYHQKALLDRLEAFLEAPSFDLDRFVGYRGTRVTHLVDIQNPSRTLCGRWIDRDEVGRSTVACAVANCAQCTTYFKRLVAR